MSERLALAVRILLYALTFAAMATGALAACSGDEGGDESDSNAQRLLDTKWILLDVAGEPALGTPEANIEFTSATEFRGTTGCNGFDGEYEASGDELRVGQTVITEIGCEGGVMAQETRYTSALTTAERFEFVDDDLLIHSADFDSPLRFKPAGSANAQATPPSAGTWTGLPPLASGARQETAVVAFQGEVVVIGGFDGRGQVSNLVEAFNPTANTWRRLPDVPVAMHHANAAVVGDRIYVLGFLTGSDFAADGRMYTLTPGATRWELAGTMPTGKQRGASGVGVIDDQVYVAGGLRNGAVTDFSRFDPVTNSWMDLASVPERRDHVVAAGLDGKFVLAGGRGGAITSITGRVDVYDPGSNTWAQGAPMLTPRAGTSGAVLEGRLFVFGGEGNAGDPSGVFREAEAYDIASNSWTALTPMATPRHGTGAASIGDSIYVPGGATRQAFGAVATSDKFTP